jgi:hypothetical protein
MGHRVGPRLAEPVYGTQVHFVSELGLTITATRLGQLPEPSCPFLDGDESGWGMQVDVCGGTEPEEGTREAAKEAECGEMCNPVRPRCTLET